MHLRQLEYFKVLAEEEHMTRSAQILNTTQPNLSHSIKNLEEELGVHLFRKEGRNIKLTKHGQQFYEVVANVLHDLETGIQALKEDVSPFSGNIDLGFTYTMSLKTVPKMVTDFHKENPNIRFTFNQGNSTDLIKKLLNEEIDIAIASKIDEYENIHYEKFIEEEIILITPLNHPLAKYDSVTINQIAPYSLVYFNESSGLRPIIDDLFKQEKQIPKIVYEVEEDHAMASLVQHEFGIGLIPNIPTLDVYDVKKIQLNVPDFERYLYIATLNTNFRNEPVQKFIDFLLENRSL